MFTRFIRLHYIDENNLITQSFTERTCTIITNVIGRVGDKKNY